jgi:hypothetical protein
MKMVLALVCSLVVVALGFAQSTPANPTPPADEAPADVTPKTPPPKPVVRIPPPTKAAEKTKAEKSAPKKSEPVVKEELKIKGIAVPRGERGFMGIEMVGGNFKISFYDTKKKPIPPDVTRAALRWDAKYKVGQERLVLNPDADGKSLSNPKTIRPPYNFKLFITLIKEATEKEEPVGETHVVDFKA